jgi:hypothetical protein
VGVHGLGERRDGLQWRSRPGKFKTGDPVVFVASGVGYNMAGAAFRMV